MHRLILNVPDDMEVDHRNLNRLDNTRRNLRPATTAQNAQNRSKRRDGRSRFRGVMWDARLNRWYGQVKHSGRTVWTRYFDLEEDAARADSEARRQLLPFSVEAA